MLIIGFVILDYSLLDNHFTRQNQSFKKYKKERRTRIPLSLNKSKKYRSVVCCNLSSSISTSVSHSDTVYSYPSLIPLRPGLSPVRYKTRFPLYLKGKGIKCCQQLRHHSLCIQVLGLIHLTFCLFRTRRWTNPYSNQVIEQRGPLSVILPFRKNN